MGLSVSLSVPSFCWPCLFAQFKIHGFRRFHMAVVINCIFHSQLVCVGEKLFFKVAVNCFVHQILESQYMRYLVITELFCLCVFQRYHCPSSCFGDCLKFVFLNSCRNNDLRMSTFYIKHVFNSLNWGVIFS